MSQYEFKVNDHVIYYPTGNQQVSTTGTIMDIISKDKERMVGSQIPHASPERPRYVIKNDNTGKETAYYLENIVSLTDEDDVEEEIIEIQKGTEQIKGGDEAKHSRKGTKRRSQE